MSSTTYRRVDASDARRPEQTRTLVLPVAWRDEGLDIYAGFLGSISMISGAAMMTRVPYIAYAGLIFACAHIAHEKPYKSTKTKDSSTGGPYMSLAFSMLAFFAVMIPKLATHDPFGITKQP